MSTHAYDLNGTSFSLLSCLIFSRRSCVSYKYISLVVVYATHICWSSGCVCACFVCVYARRMNVLRFPRLSSRKVHRVRERCPAPRGCRGPDRGHRRQPQVRWDDRGTIKPVLSLFGYVQLPSRPHQLQYRRFRVIFLCQFPWQPRVCYTGTCPFVLTNTTTT